MPMPHAGPDAGSTGGVPVPAQAAGSPASTPRRRTAATRWAVAGPLVVLIMGMVGAGLYGGGRGAPGNTKTTCLYTQHDINQLTALSATLGRPINCAITFNDATETWAQWASPWFTHAPASQPQYQWPAWVKADSKRSLVITEALVPKQVPADWRTRGAAGEYDGYARTLGTNLVAAGLGSSVIRLGHEANGSWYADNIGATAADHQAWRTYWARIALVLKSVPGAHFRLDWTVAAATAPTPFADYYPGDGAVDIVGADVYDSSTTPADRVQPARWLHELNAPGGVGALIDFAAQHDKPVSIPEWGLITADNPLGAGDDAYFVNRIADLVKLHRVSYQGYFETQPAKGVFGSWPQSEAAWVARFGARGDVRP